MARKLFKTQTQIFGKPNPFLGASVCLGQRDRYDAQIILSLFNPKNLSVKYINQKKLFLTSYLP